MSTTTVNAIASYTFSITMTDSITSTGSYKIVFPTILTINNSTSCAIQTGTSLSSIPYCYYNSVDNSIMFSSLNSSLNSIPGQTFTLVVNGIKNPPSTTQTSSFTLYSYYTNSASTLVGAGTINGVTATIATIDYTTVVISSSSLVTSATGVTYYYSFIVNNPIPVGGFIHLYFPTSIIFDLGIANNNCLIMINGSAAISTPCSGSLTSNYKFIFSNPFPSTPATVNTNITLIILNAATNPPTTQPVSPFSVATFYSDGSSIAIL